MQKKKTQNYCILHLQQNKKGKPVRELWVRRVFG